MSQPSVDILLVEDNENDVELTLAALRHERALRHFVARDGEEALQFLSELDAGLSAGTSTLPRAILLDLKLPKVSGLEVLRELKGHPRLQACPVIVLTSSTHEADMVACYRLGANSYLQKPVNFDEFRTMVRDVVNYWIRQNLVPPTAALLAESPNL